MTKNNITNLKKKTQFEGSFFFLGWLFQAKFSALGEQKRGRNANWYTGNSGGKNNQKSP
jgi:hypothetical protein